jgi:membrane complex biogenesis BtpA family protein
MSERIDLGRIWPSGPPLVGMVHLAPLPGSPSWGGSMAKVLGRAARDGDVLAAGGFDGLLVENFMDTPFHKEEVPPETVAAMARVVAHLVEATGLPIGVNVLRNAPRAAIAIAVATGARFVRVNVHSGAMWTDQGLVEGRADRTLRERARLAAAADVAIFADVFVKHATPPAGTSLTDAARDTWERGRADALVVTGPTTGGAADLDQVRVVKEAAPTAPVLVGSGVTAETVRDVLAGSDGAIVGTSIALGGRAGAGIDPDRARALARAAGRS